MRTTHRRRPATPAESARALANVQTLFGMTPRERAERRVADCKAEVSAACEAILRGDDKAAERADAATAALAAARAALRSVLDGEQ